MWMVHEYFCVKLTAHSELTEERESVYVCIDPVIFSSKCFEIFTDRFFGHIAAHTTGHSLISSIKLYILKCD